MSTQEATKKSDQAHQNLIEAIESVFDKLLDKMEEA